LPDSARFTRRESPVTTRMQLVLITGLALALMAGAVTAQAEDTKLYAFSSGALTIGKGVLQNFAVSWQSAKIVRQVSSR